MSAIIDPAHDDDLPNIPDVILNAGDGDDDRADRARAMNADAHAAAAAAEEQANALRPQGNPHEFVSLSSIVKSEPFLNVLVTIPTSLSLIIALVSDEDHSCRADYASEYSGSEAYEEAPPIKAWAITCVVLNSLLALINIILTRIFIKNPAAPNGGSVRWKLSVAVSRFLNTCWFVWFIVGAVWTFQLMKHPCHKDLPFLYNVCFVIVIFTLCSLGLAAIVCCLACVLICCGLGWMLHQQNHQQQGVDNDEQEASHGATDDQIEALPVKTFYEGMIDAPEATCSICFGDYVPGEELRFLPCHHHFHAECVDSWFTGSRACPICKHPINKPAPETSYNPEAPAEGAAAAASTDAANTAPSDDGEVSPLSQGSGSNGGNGTFAEMALN